ncbi:MAG: hypothetical protein IT355_00380 [Gemmatimonadaceae bacterium]|nr:hypothetical protein [Gemmatimonadaceae bacterium]
MTVEPHRSSSAGPRNIAARRLACGALLAVGQLATTACYAFVPTTNTALPEATPVTVRLTAAGSVALQSALGQNVNEVEGAVLRSSPDSLVVSVAKMYTTTRQQFESSGTTTSIPRGMIEEVQVRTFSRKRTVLTALGALALGIGGAASVAAGGGNAPPPGGGTTPP